NGIQGDYNSAFTANVAARNTLDGIQAFDSTVSHNNLIQQVLGTPDNAGIRSEGSTLVGNLMNDNKFGLIATGTQTGFGQNVITGNGTDVTGPANSLGTNLCQTGVCP
ncbi:MAG: hypothetical protein QNK05_21680, partial [Myxococcota bacterium]|nr:hypothetical protein [Myxococcota bacterium]